MPKISAAPSKESFETKVRNRAIAAVEKQNSYTQAVINAYSTLTVAQQAQLLEGSEQPILAFSISDKPFEHIDTVCPELKLEEDSLIAAEEICRKMDCRRRELGKEDLHYLTTSEILQNRKWVDSFRSENSVYLIPAYHEKDGKKVFALIISTHRSNFLIGSATTDQDELKNQGKLLAAYPESKPFVNNICTIYPRDHKNAICQPPIPMLRSGISAPTIDGIVKVGKGNKITLGLLEVVKFIPKET